MADPYLLSLYHIMWGLLIFTTFVFVISGLDDLFFDCYYWSYYIWRRWLLRKKSKRLTYERLSELEQKRVAVMIPCWHEAGVIEDMLRYNVYAIDYENYDLFVGVYPNDPHTVASVREVAENYPNVHAVIKKMPGPSTKADNLNSIYAHIMEYAKEKGTEYDIFVLHDSEDVIHPLSFKLYNYLMPKNDMIQIPIFPLKVSILNLTHWTYGAEFTEIHTKDIIVREKIGGLVPSAGVGTAFSAIAMNALKAVRNGVPFSINTLTEDYSTALQIRLQGLREIFVLRYVYKTQWRKKFIWFGPAVARRVREYIATRALFPMSYTAAVRQKTRWILGISFQEWTNTGWVGNIATLYTLVHDRKSMFTHIVNGLFLLLIPFWVCYTYYVSDKPQYPTLQDLFEKNPWIWWFIVGSSVMMINRIIQRTIAVKKVYGYWPALWTVPLILYGNIINLHALLRAYTSFISTPKAKTGAIAWDKTDHTFPVKFALLPTKKKLGDILINKNLLTQQQMHTAIEIQHQTGAQLGNVLVDLGYVNKHDLMLAIAEQYDLQTVSKDQIIPMPAESIPYLLPKQYKRLMKAGCIPLKIEGDHLVVTVDDPSNDIVIARVMHWAQPYKPKFVLAI